MTRSIRCPCGCQLQINSDQPGTLFRCPACQRLLLPSARPAASVQAASPSRLSPAWLMLGSALGVGLLVLAGMLVLRFHEVSAGPAPAKDRHEVMSRAALRDAVPVPKETNLHRTVAPQPQRSLPPPPKPLPAPVVSRTAPAEARVGQPFTLFLTCPSEKGQRFTYQYRSRSTDPWQAAPDGRVELARLGPGPIHLELRVVDDRGQTSPVRTQLVTPRPEPTRIVQLGPWHVGDEFYQEVVFDRQSTGQALGIAFQDHARFALLSSFHVDKITADSIELTQKVEAVRLAQSPTMLAAALADLLRQAQGKVFHLTIGPDGTVKKFEGKAKAVATERQQGADSSRFLMQTALDTDSWKELSSLTFFQPPKPAPKDGRWSRKLEHDWGPLGRWEGQMAYQATDHSPGRYRYQLELTYHPPDKSGGSLPFEVEKASFQLIQGSGTIRYDATRGRASEAEEQFHVRGTLAVSALGVQAPLEMEEIQTFHLHIFDQVPPAWRRLPQGR